VTEELSASEAIKQIDLAVNAYKYALIRDAEREARERSLEKEWLYLGEAAVRLGYSETHGTRQVIELCYEDKLKHLKNSNDKPFKVLAKSIDVYLEKKARGEV
jgi:hypothetical protein